MPAGDYGNLRYSTLDTIKTTNVMNLHVVTTFSTGVPHGHEGQPLVFGNTMYVVTPFPEQPDRGRPHQAGRRGEMDLRAASRIRARSASPAATSSTAARRSPTARSSTACSTRTVVAVDAETGKEAWRTQRRRHQQGRDVHRRADRRQGPRARRQLRRRAGRARLRRGARPQDRQGALARVQHRPGRRREDRRRISRLLREGPGQGSRRHLVAVRAMEARRLDGLGLDLVRPGDEPVLLRHRQSRRVESGSAARATTSGRRRSSRATPTPARRAGPTRSTAHDSWDYDEIMENVLVDMDYGGRPRKLLVHPGRTGFVYVLDRETGELLSAETFQPTNWASGYDLKTGKPHEDPAKQHALRHASRRASVPRRPAPRTSSRRRSRRAPACSTSPRTTPAWTTKASRPTTSPARRTSAPT